MERFLQKVELRHFRYFLAVAEHGGIRRAARNLSLEASTVSKSVRDLEDEIGVALFIREDAGIILTHAGKRFLQRAQRIVDQVCFALHDAAMTGIGQEGVVRVGLMSSMASGFISELVDAYAVDHPDVRIDYFEGDGTDHIAAIQQHRLDVAFLTGSPNAEGCDVLHLWNERIYVAMSDGNVLATKEEVSWNDLRDQAFIVSEEQSGAEIFNFLVKHLADLRHSPCIRRQAVYRDTLMQIVAAGSNLTLTSEATIAAQFPSVVYRPLTSELLPFCAVWSPRNDNPAFRRLLSLAKGISTLPEVPSSRRR